MIAIKSAVLKVWDVLLCEGNRNMFFRIGLSLMEIHGRVGRLVSEHLRWGLFVVFARGPHFFLWCPKSRCSPLLGTFVALKLDKMD
jgi:hypothetical protein